MFYLVASAFCLQLFLPSFLLFLQRPATPFGTLKIVILGFALGALANIATVKTHGNLHEVVRVGLLVYSLTIISMFTLVDIRGVPQGNA